MSSQDEVTTILWTKEMGERMRTMRMRLLWDQAFVAAKFGMSQSSYSKLETGHMKVSEKITVIKFKEVFGTVVPYILYGNNPERFDSNKIHIAYWKQKLLINRRNRSKHRNLGGY